MIRSPSRRILSVRIAALLRLASAGLAGSLVLATPFVARAGCDNHAPGAGETVTCSPVAPNPDTTGVTASAGSTDVTVDVQAGAALSIGSGGGITIRDQSQVTNAGSIALAPANTFDAIFAEGSGNDVLNSGDLTTSASFADGIQANGSDNTLANADGGTIATSGDSANGMLSLNGSGNVLTNDGVISTAGSTSSGLRVVGGDGNVLGNGATGTIGTTGEGAHGLWAGGGATNTTFDNAGTINVSGASADGIHAEGTGITIDNSGTIESAAGQGVFLSDGGGVVNNAAGGSIQGITGVSSIGALTLVNEGDITGIGGVAIQTGAGSDSVTVLGGTITGDVVQGNGNDHFEISDGQVAGAVSQGGGVDTFIMTGGTIDSLNQGSSLDTAEMHGGHIVGLFFAGDFFTMTDGRIGEVNLEQANNEMRMSGGTIDGNVRAAQGHDLLEFSAGSIGGDVNYGNGNNTVIVTGGDIAGGVLTGNGTDIITVDGGTVAGALSSGAGDDGITVASGSAGSVDAGDGDDTAVLSGGSVGGDVLTGAGMDSVSLSGTAVAGDIDTGDGDDVVQIDAGSADTVITGNGDDSAVWTGGTILGFDGGDGSDTLTVGSGADFSGATLLDGGDDISEADGWIDVLTLIGVTASTPSMVNWERIDLTDGTQFQVGPEGENFGGGVVAIDDTSSIIAQTDSNATIAFDNDVENDGIIDTSDSGTDVSIGGDLENNGEIDISDGGGDLIVDGDVDNSGTIDTSGGGGDIVVGGDVDNSDVLDISDDGGDVMVDGTLHNGGTIEAGGTDSTITAGGGVINDGIINMVDGGTQGALTIDGDLTGSGTIAVDTAITEDGGDADQIIVTGDVTGNTNTVINQTGEPLAGIPGTDSGATIISTGGEIVGTFTLNEPFNYTPIGPWRYELRDDGIEGLGLRAVFDGGFAALTPSAAAAAVAPDAVLAGTQSFLPNIREREGQTVLSRDGRMVGWLRAFGGRSELDGAGYEVGYEADVVGLQGAFGFAREGDGGGEFLAGVTLGQINGDWTPELRSARADMDVDGYAWGLYGTWFQDATQQSGWYGDAIVQFSRFDLDIRIPISPIASFDGKGLGASVEFGHLSRRGDWRMEPQGRLVFLRSELDAFTGLDGLQVDENDNDRLLARLGLRLSRDYRTDGSVLTASYKGAVWHRLGGDDGAVVGMQVLDTHQPDTFGELGVGLDWTSSGRVSFYTQLEGRFAGDYRDYSAEIGLRARW